METHLLAAQPLTLSLLRAALWPETPVEDFPPLEPALWEALLRLAREQACLGLVYDGLSRVRPQPDLPTERLFPLVSEIAALERRSRQVFGAARLLLTRLRAEGLHPLLLKGPSLARRYPEPLHRSCGDIDLYFRPEEWEAASTLLATLGAWVEAPDGSRHLRYQGIDVDLHAQYYDLHVSPAALPPVPSPEAEILMLAAHILKHAIGPGVGLKQFCDLALVLAAYPGEMDALRPVFAAAGLRRWGCLLSAFLARELGCSRVPYPEEQWLDPAPLSRIVWAGGEFGHHAPARARALRSSPIRRKWDTGLRHLRHLPFALRYAPRELLARLKTLVRGNLHHAKSE